MTKYGPAAQASVKRTLHKFKQGRLKRGRTHTLVTSRDQAIAIGLSEARKKGVKVPLPKA